MRYWDPKPELPVPLRSYPIASLVLFATSPAQDAPLPPMEILGNRLAGQTHPGEIASWSADELRDGTRRTLDEWLASSPSFSLYRRQASWFGNPTSAGVSLRNTGATATSRTLVVLDGVPQNDPFGGWVSWPRYDPGTLESLRIIGPSRSTAWGNQSPAGTIQLTSRRPFSSSRSLGVRTGSFGTAAASAWNQSTNPDQTISVHASAYGFHTDGFQAVPRRQMGPVDEALRSDFAGMTTGGAWRVGPHLTIQPRISYHWEDRCNGTDLTGNSTKAFDASLHLTSENPASQWQLLAYHQIREFSSVFSSVAPGRISESVALDQYQVPAHGTGASWVLKKQFHPSLSMTTGADMRWLDGETRENAGAFRNRVAGGNQSHQGWFLSPQWQPNPQTTLSATMRLDAWQLYNGRRHETLIATGTVARDDRHPDRHGWEPSLGADLTHQWTDRFALFTSAGSSFRLPTLNELHRPFRVRDDIVEANPALDPERFFQVSVGADWKPMEDFSFRIDAFHHWIEDVIANVPVTDPAEAARIYGTIPPGGSLSQRGNIDLATVAGIEWSAEWIPHQTLTMEFRQLWSDTRFRKSSDQPWLRHSPFPQAPAWRSLATVRWEPLAELCVHAEAEHVASQFDGAMASRELAAYTNLRAGVRWKHNRTTYGISVDNLLDAEIQAAIASNDILTTASPRTILFSMILEF